MLEIASGERNRSELFDTSIEAVFRQMADAVIVVEASGDVLFANERARDLAGHTGSPEPWNAEDVRLTVQADGRDLQRDEWPLWRSLAGEHVRDEDVSISLLDGERFFLRCSSSPVRDDEGQITGAILIAIDVTEEKRAQERLAYQAHLLANIEEAVIATDERFVLTAWNDGAERLYGWTHDQAIGRHVQELGLPDTGDEDMAAALRELTELGRWRGEAVIDRKDGTPVDVELLAVAIRDETGATTGYVGIHRDISERRRIEEERRLSEERSKALFEQAAVGMSETATDGTLLRVNQQLCDILGYTREELVGTKMQEGTHPDDLAKDLEQAGQLMAGEIDTYSIEKRLLRKDASIVWVNLTVSLVRGTSPESTYFIAVCQDISERKRSEAALEDASTQTQLILESITDGFYALDPQWRFTYLNARAVRFASQLAGREFTREGLLGVTLWEALPATVATKLENEYHRAIATQESAVFEYPYPGDGPWFEVHVYPSEQGLSIYFQEITGRKRAEEEQERFARQQAAVAELGLRAVAAGGVEPLMEHAVELVAEALEVDLTKVLELVSDRSELLMRAGVGWRPDAVGKATEPSGPESQAGYTVFTGRPVAVDELATDPRFTPSALTRTHGAVSQATAVIAGREQPFGVLGALSTTRRPFSEDDLNFLQAVANVLATAVERTGTERRMHDVREAERQRIARDLHDDALPDLTNALVTAHQAQAASPDRTLTDRLAHLVSGLKRVGRQLRGAIYDLRLSGEENEPFPKLLASLVELQRAMAGDCRVELELRSGAPTGSLGPRGTEILRIVGEALTNSRRHAGASIIRVSAWGSQGRLSVEVSDDGYGFESVEPSGTDGSGIKGMRERALGLGGELRIQSEIGAGTRVRLELPPEHDGSTETVRLLLVDDHASVREAIAATCERHAGFEVVAQAASLAEARERLNDIDVAIVDLGLPDGYGGDLIAELREVNPQAQALVLSAGLNRSELARAVENGAAGALDKTVHLYEVVDAVRRLRAGKTLLPMDEIVELLQFAGTQRRREHEDRQALAGLTPREREVLQALAEGLDSRGVADRLHITIRTERNHVASILAKLGVHSQLQALVFALRYGAVEIR